MTVLHFTSLRSRLFAVVALAITPFVLYGALHAIRGRSGVSTLVQAETLAQARVTARHLDAQLQLIEQLLDSAMTQVHRPGRPLQPPQLSDSLNRALANTLTIAVLDASGRRTGLVIGDGARVDAIPLARRTIAVGTAIGSARRQAASSTAAATFVDEGDARSDADSIAVIIVRPITRSRTRCNCLADAPGAVMAVISDRTVQHLVGGDTLPAGGLAVMTGSVGGLLGRPMLPGGWSDRDTRDSAVLSTRVQREGLLQLQGKDGARRTFGFAALDRLPWRVYVGAPLSAEASAPAHVLRDLLLLSLLALTIAAVGVVMAMRRHALSPRTSLATVLAPRPESVRTAVPAAAATRTAAMSTAAMSTAATSTAATNTAATNTAPASAAATRSVSTNSAESTAANIAASIAAARPAAAKTPVAAPRAKTTPAQLSAVVDHADQIAFAGHIADDLDAIMQGIAGFTQLALDSADDPDMRNIAVERIRDLAATGLAMARQMQAYGARDALNLQIIDANETLTAAVQSMAETLDREVDVEALYNVSPAVMRADERLLSQVVTALIANARDAMPAGGTLTVASTFVEVPVHAREPYAATPGEYIVLTVADTGMGMSPDAQRHMFEPFWSTKPQQIAGVGLGLAAVAGIAREHGWTISVESEPEIGTAVSLYIPYSNVMLTAPAAPVGQSTRATEPARSV